MYLYYSVLTFRYTQWGWLHDVLVVQYIRSCTPEKNESRRRRLRVMKSAYARFNANRKGDRITMRMVGYEQTYCLQNTAVKPLTRKEACKDKVKISLKFLECFLGLILVAFNPNVFSLLATWSLLGILYRRPALRGLVYDKQIV